jgi:hypothetical protein
MILSKSFFDICASYLWMYLYLIESGVTEESGTMQAKIFLASLFRRKEDLTFFAIAFHPCKLCCIPTRFLTLRKRLSG